ncbi:hypothetical protein JTE90_025320 [Oedothorax gibbosus]|uniref:Uncharacterized protein n=1 Tax=Oedothorax gibbosus TaxID=931172 RepID=A0AAV6V5M9_9ARAC|nr:hypothetical protein JTE90_025320 [Oedothorax gibbosus]
MRTTLLSWTILLCSVHLCLSAIDVIRVCCFSKSPDDYPPNCYECSKQVYPNALLACVNATEMPKNISYKAAGCLEKNCQVQYPTQASFTLAAAKSSPWWNVLNAFSKLIMPLTEDAKQKRSVEDNYIDDEEGVNIVGEVFTFVDEKQIEFGEPEYS